MELGYKVSNEQKKKVSETDYLKTAEARPERPFVESFHLLRWNTSYAGGGNKTSCTIDGHRVTHKRISGP